MIQKRKQINQPMKADAQLRNYYFDLPKCATTRYKLKNIAGPVLQLLAVLKKVPWLPVLKGTSTVLFSIDNCIIL